MKRVIAICIFRKVATFVKALRLLDIIRRYRLSSVNEFDVDIIVDN